MWFVGRGISVAPQCLNYNGMLWDILLLWNNFSAYNLYTVHCHCDNIVINYATVEDWTQEYKKETTLLSLTLWCFSGKALCAFVGVHRDTYPMTFDLREGECQERQGTDLWNPAPSHQLQRSNDIVSSDRDHIHIDGPSDRSMALKSSPRHFGCTHLNSAACHWTQQNQSTWCVPPVCPRVGLVWAWIHHPEEARPAASLILL